LPEGAADELVVLPA